MKFSFEYRKLGDFTYNVLSDPLEIKTCLMKWIMREWEIDHREAPDEHWTVAWMDTLPKLEFALQVIHLDDIRPNADLMSVAEFQTSLKERADEREEAMLRGVSIEPLLVHRTPEEHRDYNAALVHRTAALVRQDGFELMDGYTRYAVLNRYEQKEVYAYVGSIPG